MIQKTIPKSSSNIKIQDLTWTFNSVHHWVAVLSNRGTYVLSTYFSKILANILFTTGY